MANLPWIILFNLALFCIQNEIIPQSADKRPKVGLALSGGGSLGMAHIGVLKVMEEAGLRPDYITGVSMGSIVGGLYAIGYSADSLQNLFRDEDWNFILSNNIPENKVIFTEKKYFNNSIMALPITLKKVRLPSGLINGQQIEKMLSYYAWPAADINDFSRLPIPFMCIGTDLVSCKKVDLKTGYLPDAIRASMAVPSIFTPIKIDSSVLIDGGFVRNIAVSELKNMGADIIIGSYTGFQRYNENELQTVTGVLKQLSFFNSFKDYTQEKKLINYLIEPKVKDLSSAVFTNADSIIHRGYIAALPFQEKFKKLADSLNAFGPRKPVASLLYKQLYTFDRIKITGNEVNTEAQILGVLDIKAHIPVDKNTLTDKIDLLYGSAWFDKVKYRILPKNDSLILLIECVEKPKAMLYGSVHYDNSLRAGILISMSSRNLITKQSVLEISSFIGQFYRFRSSFTKFIDRNQKLGLSVYFNGDNTLIRMMSLKDETGQIYSKDFRTGLRLDKRIGLNQMMSISSGFQNQNLIPDYITASQIKRISYNKFSAIFLDELNTLDTKHFPKKGTLYQIYLNADRLISGTVRTSFYKKTYTETLPGDFLFRWSYSIKANLRHYFSAGRKLTFVYGGDALMTQTKDTVLSPNNYYFIGGQDYNTEKSIPVSGFYSNEIPVGKAASAVIGGDFEFYQNLHLNLMTNLAICQETGKGKGFSVLGGYAVSLGYLSLIGPVRVGLVQGFSSKERYFNSVKGFISIGYSF